MNASFRTAFWAMCLGLTVPMMLFVSVRLATDGRESIQHQSVLSGPPGSLQSHWSPVPLAPAPSRPRKPAPARPDRRPSPSQDNLNEGAGPNLAVDNHNGGARLVPRLDPEPEPGNVSSVDGNPAVTLVPELEVDPAIADAPASAVARIPAVPTGNHTRLDTDPQQLSPALTAGETRIESQLDEILEYLDRLANRTPSAERNTSAELPEQALLLPPAEPHANLSELRASPPAAQQPPEKNKPTKSGRAGKASATRQRKVAPLESIPVVPYPDEISRPRIRPQPVQSPRY